MGFFGSMDISTSALTAQRLRMDVITENIANANTTRTENGQPYRRRTVVFAQKEGASFSSYLDGAQRNMAGKGVVATSIVEDESEFIMEFDPTHPDADANGYVSYPNVNEVTEMIDMMSATRSFEANVTALNASKSMAMKALEIGR